MHLSRSRKGLSRSHKGRYVLLGALLGASFLGCRSSVVKTGRGWGAIFRSISEERHTDPPKALARAEQACQDAEAKHVPARWEQAFRLLYADMLVEQSETLEGRRRSEVTKLLAFTPQDAETGARQMATQAYADRKAGDLAAAKKISETVLAMTGAVHDPCWRAEVLVHYVQTLTDMGVDAAGAIAKADGEVQACSDPYWQAAWNGTKGYRYYTLFRYEQEKAAFAAALNLAESHHFPALIGSSKRNLVIADLSLGDSDSALRLLVVRDEGGPSNPEIQARSLALEGAVHYQRSEYEAARVDYRRAVELLKGERQSDDYYSDLEELAAAQLELNHLPEAEAYNREVIDHAGPEVEPWVREVARINVASIARMRGDLVSSLQQLRGLENSLGRDPDSGVVTGVHSELGQTLAALGRKKEAEREFKMAVDAANKFRSGISSNWSRLTYSVYSVKLVAPYVDFRVDQNDAAGALELAETFRAQQLAEKLHSSKAPAPERFRQIARNRNAVILSYWITAKHSYVWATTAKETKVFPLTGLETLSRDIENHNREIGNYRDLLASPDLAMKLYKKLVTPVESAISPGANVIIVPDGPLAALNFETLIPPATPHEYWLNNVSVTVAPSLAVLANDQTLKGKPRRFLLVGGAIPRGLAALPDREVPMIQQVFPAVSHVSLTGREATPQRFLASEPGEFSLLHISAHAFANKESPLDSAIFLSPDEAHRDGKLYAHDLEDLNLTAQLVTLSACESAGGRNLPGEGQVGLTWAILSAGAHNVVASLWKVSASATAEFMRQFYTDLRTNEDPAKALHDAKLAIAKKQPLPYYWAGFQLYTR